MHKPQWSSLGRARHQNERSTCVWSRPCFWMAHAEWWYGCSPQLAQSSGHRLFPRHREEALWSRFGSQTLPITHLVHDPKVKKQGDRHTMICPIFELTMTILGMISRPCCLILRSISFSKARTWSRMYTTWWMTDDAAHKYLLEKKIVLFNCTNTLKFSYTWPPVSG